MDSVTKETNNARLDPKLREAFPPCEPGARPFGNRVLVQLRTPKRRTAGGIVLPDESRDFEKWMTTVGILIDVGPLAFRDRASLKAWPEGIWCEPGDYVRVPKYGGDRWEIALSDEPNAEVARFVIYRDHELIAIISGDPLGFIDYV